MRTSLRNAVLNHGRLPRRTTRSGDANEDQVLKEFYLAKSRPCELVFTAPPNQPTHQPSEVLRSQENGTNDGKVKVEHLEAFVHLFDGLPDEARRTGIEGTLHRISRSMHAVSRSRIAVTARIGPTIQGHVLPILVDTSKGDTCQPDELARFAEKGVMLIGPPNTGKTTVLRELARVLSHGTGKHGRGKRVVVVADKSLEIGGTGEVPHHAIGNARVITVHGNQQAKAMLEAVENQSPDIVIVDELSTKEEAQVARTIIGRGVALIASVHGDSIRQIIDDPERSVLVGGIASVTLSAREAEAREDQLRQVQRRYSNPVFGAAIELRQFDEWVVHRDVERAIDAYLDFKAS